MTPTYQKDLVQKNLRKLLKHKFAVGGLCVLIMLYSVCIVAEFIAPYHYDNEARANSYNPPTAIHWVDATGKFHFRPFVYASGYAFDAYQRRIFTEKKEILYPVKFFVKGDSYRLCGLIPGNRHFFGVESGSRIYLMGADARGRDLFSRLVYGSRVSLTIGFIGVFISTVIGLLVGGISGYYGGRIDDVLMRVCEMVMLVPSFFLLLALRAAFPPEMSSVKIYLLIVFILSFIGWAGLARVIRGMTKSIAQREFVVAAEALGQKNIIIIIKHIIPQTFSFLIVSITLSIPAYILGESGLSLIGLGIQDPYASWGNMLSDAMNIADIKFHPWILIPGFFIFITVMAFNFLGDGLRDVFDPKSGR
ncbi:MAG: ABC transporter permease [Chitinivibrionales bacterium]|nr:ABC transporter permease [Chitinivibrionales bacterium]